MLIGRVDACNTRFFSQHQDPVRCSFTWVAWAYNHADTIDMHGVTCVQFGLSLTMIRFLYDLTMRLAAHRWALPLLAVISFLESSVFPIPPDVMLIPMVLAQPRRAFLIAGICLLASVLGGLLGYIVGALAFDQFGAPILQFFGQEHAADEFIKTYNQYGAWAVLFAGLTPFPLQDHYDSIGCNRIVVAGLCCLKRHRTWDPVLSDRDPALALRWIHQAPH